VLQTLSYAYRYAYRSLTYNMPARRQKRSLSAEQPTNDQPTTSGTGSNEGPSTDDGKSKPKHKQRKLSAGAIDDAINTVLLQSQMDADDSESESDGDDDLRQQVELLRNTVEQQKDEIARLQVQLSRLMSFMGITNVTTGQPSPGMSTSAGAATTAAANHGTAADGTAAADDVGPTDDASFTAVVSRRRGGGQNVNSAVVRTLDEAVMAAVYNDQKERERRSKTLIISGLLHDARKQDVDIFRQLCQLEFGLDPDIKTCKRIGQRRDDKPQPLLVVFGCANEANGLITRAKQLRHSTSPHVRDNVFINRNLTKAEEKAAYDERCRRRQRATTMNGRPRQQQQLQQRSSTTDGQFVTDSLPASASTSVVIPTDSTNPAAPVASTSSSVVSDVGRPA
jgi:hypothetical protein